VSPLGSPILGLYGPGGKRVGLVKIHAGAVEKDMADIISIIIIIFIIIIIIFLEEEDHV
jgi:hypothetical protein